MTDYLAATNRPLMVADVAVGHIGHYIWNAISGWPALLQLAPQSSIDIIATNRQAQIFGGVKELFPDLVAQSGQLIEVDNEYELYRTMLRTGALAMFVLDRQVRQELAKRVIGWCQDALFRMIS